MKRSYYRLAIVTLLMGGMVLVGTSCKKKGPPVVTQPTTTTPTPPTPTAPAPTISLSASPTTISSGQSATLTWNSSNATSVTIDHGIGSVEAAGKRTVSPTSSTTFTAVASGPGGRSEAAARITVTEAPVTPPPRPALTASEFVAGRIHDIFFDFDKYDIREDARETLMGNARALSERTDINLIIEGHCDERGSEKYNLALGDRRANAAKEFLVGQNVSGNRLDTISYGEERPFAEGSTEEAYQQNRRAHFKLKE